MREAVANANTDSNSGGNGCDPGTGDDTITFSGDLAISLTTAPGKIIINDSNNTTTIDGETNDVVVADSSKTIFQIKSDTTVRNLTIKNGSGNSGFGGSLVVDSPAEVTLEYVVMTENSVSSSGGAISAGNNVKLTIRNSTRDQ